MTDLFDFEQPPVPPDSAPRSDAERLDWLRLARSHGVGPAAFAQLLRRKGSARAALLALPELSRRGGRALEPASEDDAAAEMERAAKLGARLLCLGEAAYPPLLARIEGPPPVLWLLGRAEALVEQAVALVGSRNASALGRRFAEKTARALAEAGWLVVSGLARGVDAAAHLGALEAEGGLTAAALAGGVDVHYPPENKELHARIRERGALISEMPMGLEPMARHFPRRNRLVSGLARGVLVIEGAERSGALITARAALEQGREAMAAPGHPWDPRAGGSNLLIREGAALIRGPEDVIEALETATWRRPRPRAATPDPAPAADEVIDREADPEPDTPPDAAAKLLALLSLSPVETDRLTRASGLEARIVAQALLELELAGRVERRPGGMVCLAPEG